jgi:hypothetical protein
VSEREGGVRREAHRIQSGTGGWHRRDLSEEALT